jgi:hypothetical protein
VIVRTSPTRLLPYVLAFALGAGAAGLTACGSTSKALIPAADADTLKGHLDALNAAIDSGKCDKIDTELGQLRTDLDQLPLNVSTRLKSRLREGISRLETQAPHDCQANTATTDTTPTITTVTTPTVTTTTTPTTTVPTTPTTTTPTTPTTTTPTTPTTTNDTGGVGVVTSP